MFQLSTSLSLENEIDPKGNGKNTAVNKKNKERVTLLKLQEEMENLFKVYVNLKQPMKTKMKQGNDDEIRNDDTQKAVNSNDVNCAP